MDPKELLKQLGDKNIILDFDGVMTNLLIDWRSLKTELKQLLDLNEPLDIGRMYLISQIYKKRDKYLKLVEKYEMAGLNCNNTSPLFDHLQKSQIKFDIFSSNSKKTIQHFLDSHKLLVETIIGVEDVIFIKPNPEGLLKIVGDSPEDFIFLGDSVNDKIAACLAQVQFIDYEF